jgi:Icc protein
MWRFVHLSDTHLASTVDGQWNNRFLCTMMPEVIRCLRRDLAQIQPDFLLVTGDIASQHTRDAVFASRDMLDSLGFPYYPMGGNHDFVVEGSRTWFIEAYAAQLPGRDTVYSFTHQGLHFCVLDPWWKWRDDSIRPISEKSVANALEVSLRGMRWALPAHQLGWLDGDLAAHSGLPTVVALHCPLIPIPRRMHRPGMKDEGHLDNADRVFEILARHAQVKAVMSGHVHMHFIERRDGVTHIATGAMPEFPCEFREISVYDDRMEIRTCELSDREFANRSLIPGKDWTAGQPQDRRATIFLAR